MKPAFMTVFNLFMSFMKEKIRKRVSQQYNITIFWDVYVNSGYCKLLAMFRKIIVPLSVDWLNPKTK
jgi:hypothetical protein